MNQETLTQAISYANSGYIVIKVRGKRPLEDEWTSSPYLWPEDVESEFKNWKGNFGIVIGKYDLIIDIDPRNFVCTKCNKIEKLCDCETFIKDKPHVRLFKEAGVDIKKYAAIIKTGGGGLHLYLKISENIKIKENQPNWKGVEFKTKGRQVVGIGSIHPDTKKPYIFEGGRGIDDVQEAPQKLLDVICRYKVKQKSLDDGKKDFSGNIDESEPTVQRYIEYLKEAEPAVQGDAGDNSTYQVACKGRDFGFSEAKCYELMSLHYNPRCIPSWNESALKNKVLNAYAYSTGKKGSALPETDFEKIEHVKLSNWRGWDETKEGKLSKTINNCVNFFIMQKSVLKDSLIYNEFNNKVMVVKHLPWWNKNKTIYGEGIEWEDSDTDDLKLWLSREKFFDISANVLDEAVGTVARMKSIHPVKDYLRELSWDGVSRLEDWLIKYAGAKDNIYVKAVSKTTLMQAVERIYFPGRKADTVMILEGPQGIGKSSLIQILGGEYYGDFPIDPGNKDTVDAMQGKWINEMAEMQVLGKADARDLKSFITKTEDRVRLAYARRSKSFKRQCIFIGTVNPDGSREYLIDTTGNRRFLPIEIGQVKFKKLESMRDQLFAEAVDRILQGEKTYITDKEVLRQAKIEQRLRQTTDAWLSIIQHHVDEKKLSFVTGAEIWTLVLGGNAHAIHTGHQRRIANCLQECGYLPKVSKRNGKPIRGFESKEYIELLKDMKGLM